MTLITRCLNCNEYSKNYKSECSYKCSKKGKSKIIPKTLSIMNIKEVLENNIGINISEGNISIYSREIKELVNHNENLL